MAYIKFNPNISEIITFNVIFKDKQTGQDFIINQWGKKQWAYGVENRGEKKTVYASEYLKAKLEEFEPLKGKTLEITFVVEGDTKMWKVFEKGQTNFSSEAQNQATMHETPQNSTNTPQRQYVTLDEHNLTINKMREAFGAMKEQIADLSEHVSLLQEVLDELRNNHKPVTILNEQDKKMAEALGMVEKEEIKEQGKDINPFA